LAGGGVCSSAFSHFSKSACHTSAARAAPRLSACAGTSAIAALSKKIEADVNRDIRCTVASQNNGQNMYQQHA
jgi:hypothetical protein